MVHTFHFIFHMQLQKSLTNSENERRVVTERLEASQQTLVELRRMNQHLTDQNQRLQTELANNEVQRSGLEAQLRLASWPPEGAGPSSKDEELMQQLRTSQRERMELRGKVESLSDKVNTIINSLHISYVSVMKAHSLYLKWKPLHFLPSYVYPAFVPIAQGFQ